MWLLQLQLQMRPSQTRSQAMCGQAMLQATMTLQAMRRCGSLLRCQRAPGSGRP